MAVNSYDPTNGRPIFNDNDAPDIKVDPGAAATYAADVGNRIVRANLAALDSYAYKREGLQGYAQDTDIDYLHNGTGWEVAGGATKRLTGLATAGWGTISMDEITRAGRVVMYRFNAARTSNLTAGSAIANIPDGYRATRNVWGFAWGLGGATNAVQVYFDAGANQVKTQIAINSGQSIALALMWEL